MKPHISNAINAVVLIVMPVVGYLLKDSPSMTSLIPAVFGLLLLGCHNGIKNQNKSISVVAVVLTVIILLLLIMPLLFVFRKEDVIGIIQICAMMITSFLAIIFMLRGLSRLRYLS